MAASTLLEYITPLNVDGLEGRMLYSPSLDGKKREILLIYGHHPSIERWFGLVEALNEYGSVTLPDLPGFGGMDSFYKIGKKPTFDAYAEYLANFINSQFMGKKITLIGISFGFTIITRMFELYPEMTAKVEILVSLIGFMHKDDFRYSKPKRLLYAIITRFLASRSLSFIFKNIVITDLVVGKLYMRLPNAKRRMIEVSEIKIKEAVEFDIHLWKINDVRTHWQTSSEALRLNNCKHKINLPIYHVASQADHMFNSESVTKHMRGVFKSCKSFSALSQAHAPSIISGKDEAAVLLPSGLRQVLSS